VTWERNLTEDEAVKKAKEYQEEYQKECQKEYQKENSGGSV
jgi:hypothetical protein